MKKYFLLLFVVFSCYSVQAQKVTVKARIDSTVMWIGNQTIMAFEVSQLPNQKVQMPLFSDSIVTGLQMVEPPKNDTLKSINGHIVVSQKYLVTAFKDSLIYIPPFPFISNGDTVWSNSLSLKVVQPFKIDTASHKIADIKPVMNAKFDWVGFFKIILLILLIIALLIIGYILIRKYWLNKPIFESSAAKELLPPHVIALSELDKIKQEKPWQQGRIKEYHTRLTDVIRAYIEREFLIKSMEMTSEEILDHLSKLRSENKSAFMELKQILQLADLVKFAKWVPMTDENESSLNNAYSFVNETKVEVIAVEEEKPIEVASQHDVE
jgi:hypothetical protein